MPWSSWIRGAEVEPSLYGGDFANLGAQIESLMRAGCKVFHFDVGDGHFVEPITMGPIVLQSISPLIASHPVAAWREMRSWTSSCSMDVRNTAIGTSRS